MDLAIGIRRAIVKNELFMSCVGLQFLLIDTLLLPEC